MITRRLFVQLSTAGTAAMSLLGSAFGASAQGQSILSISSPSRALDAALQGTSHITLGGDRLADMNRLERLMSEGTPARLRLSVDAADQEIVELALSRVKADYVPAAATVAGVAEFVLANSTAGA